MFELITTFTPADGIRWLPADAVPDLGFQRKDARTQRRKGGGDFMSENESERSNVIVEAAIERQARVC